MDRNEARQKAIELVDKMTIEELTTQLRFDAQAIERLGIPEYNWWNEGLHGLARAGSATIFPQAIGMAATFDEETVEKVGEIVSTETRAKYNAYHGKGDNDIYKGLTLWSPNVNIFRDPRWGRGHETYGEDPYLTSRLGVAYVKGLQGNGDTLRTAACAKHFAVHSGPEADRHHFNAKVSAKDLRETYLPAFEACVKEAKVEAVMGAYNRTNDEPCCASTELMENILRQEWGFEGHYVSDCWAIRDFHENHMVTNNPRESVALALSRGCDVNCGSTYLCMLQAYNEKLITKEQIKKAAVHLFTTRYMLGMFQGSEYDELPYSIIENRDHLAYSQEVAEKSMVLLKNQDMLPLNKNELKSIAVIGPNANSRAALVGNYHGTASRYWTVTEGIQDYLKDDDIRVFYSEGSHLFKDRVENLAKKNDRLSEAQIVAEQADVVVLCLGLDETLEGEEGDTGNSYASGDKVDLQLPQCQRDLLNALIEVGKPIILLNMTGSSIDLSAARDSQVVKAIIQTWYPGAQGGRAIARVLFGEVSPSGKLPITFYNNIDELPAFTDYAMKGRTYRYFEKKPQYPFGYGLTYSRVEAKACEFENIEALKADLSTESEKLEENWYNIRVTVENSGKYDTDEVIQIYIKDKQSEYAVPNHSLCGIKRVSTKAGQTADYQVRIPGKAFMVYDNEGKRRVDSRAFEIYAGVCQPEELSCQLTATSPVKVTLDIYKI